MKYLLKLWQQSKVVRYRLEDLTTMRTTILSVLGAILVTSLLLLPLYLIIIQLFMFVSIHVLLIVLLLILTIGALFLYEYTMYEIHALFEPKIKNLNTKLLVIIEGSILSAIILVIGIIFIFVYLRGV